MPGSAGKDGGRAGIARRALAAAVVAAALAAGCSLDSEQAGAGSEPAPAVPDTVATNVVHRVDRDGHLSLELTAARAESWNDTKTTILAGARFSEFDAAGTAVTRGEAGKVVYHTDSDDAEISGGVHVRSSQEKGSVTADTLSWENKARRLSAPPAEVVTLLKDDGTTLQGSGFTGDFRTRELTFTGPSQGTYVSSDEQQ
jgi:LPS export ABC transporter protein LptC